MAKRTWNENSAKARIATRLNEVKTIDIKEYVRDTDLSALATAEAYRVNGVHVYVDILNIGEMLNNTDFEGERCHKRTLRFLNNHFRAVRNILLDVDAIQVDFHNQRLHMVVTKPYNDEAARIHRAVATAQLIRDVLAKTNEDGNEPLPAAITRVGIDSGKALAVNNGRKGSREPLFLGNPANQAAKRAGGGTAAGIFMTNTARKVVCWDAVLDQDKTALTSDQISTAQKKAALEVTVDQVMKDWKKDLDANPISSYQFYRHTPPFQTLDLEVLTPQNARRQESTSVYADIDNFTVYVADRIDSDSKAKDIVRTLHVLRSELDAVLDNDFAGLKVRFIGDCLHGILVEGTSATTDDAETAKNALLCAAAMRSSFKVAIQALKTAGVDAGDLGLAIGLEHGITSVTRLGVKGQRIRCCISRSVFASEKEQLRCSGRQTAVGETLNKHAPAGLKAFFGASRRCSDFEYAAAEQALKPKDEKANAAGGLLKAATAASAGFSFGPSSAQPSKTPAGFS